MKFQFNNVTCVVKFRHIETTEVKNLVKTQDKVVVCYQNKRSTRMIVQLDGFSSMVFEAKCSVKDSYKKSYGRALCMKRFLDCPNVSDVLKEAVYNEYLNSNIKEKHLEMFSKKQDVELV